ncbi:uncharacterized protein LOC121380152 [Gigantopelta aegis]|uniref:uncharacterized protein LOC121380152 n=1 Tax=Gigantopelta aegis TaxID=1735272 RepID=UPI001B887DCA|nr:uncharacterized protein LOC121380152 [Gigantopelta aegis]XP_041364877.1 uncharacterized protein LOC121380152 [Gigantopelta aegis]
MEISETENYTPEFVVVDQGTDRGKPKLIETIGYAYTRKKVNGDRINWTCSVRGTHNWCKATVNQNGNIFSRGKVEHNHQAKPGLLHRTEENKQVKTLAAEHIFRSAKEIVESVKLAADQVENIQSDSCTFDSWARKANRHRKKFRPDDPKDLQFDVDVEYLCSVDSDAETFFPSVSPCQRTAASDFCNASSSSSAGPGENMISGQNGNTLRPTSWKVVMILSRGFQVQLVRTGDLSWFNVEAMHATYSTQCFP